MKLALLLEDRKAMLKAQQFLLDQVDDPDFNVSLKGGELRFSHPKMTGNVIFGPMDYADTSSTGSQALIKEVTEHYHDIGMKPLWVQCQNAQRSTMIVAFKTLDEAIDAALAYDGACVEDLDQESVVENLAFYLNDGIITASELDHA